MPLRGIILRLRHSFNGKKLDFNSSIAKGRKQKAEIKTLLHKDSRESDCPN